MTAPLILSQSSSPLIVSAEKHIEWAKEVSLGVFGLLAFVVLISVVLYRH